MKIELIYCSGISRLFQNIFVSCIISHTFFGITRCSFFIRLLLIFDVPERETVGLTYILSVVRITLSVVRITLSVERNYSVSCFNITLDLSVVLLLCQL